MRCNTLQLRAPVDLLQRIPRRGPKSASRNSAASPCRIDCVKVLEPFGQTYDSTACREVRVCLMVDVKTALVNALVEASPADRRRAYAILRTPGSNTDATLSYVIDELGSDDNSMRFQAAMRLAEIGPAGIEAKTRLTELLTDDDAAVRLAATLVGIDPVRWSERGTGRVSARP